jgi:zinc D-Ala-D-Ala carboxypeptidase
MKLSAHFTLDELTHTDQRGIDNTCPPELMENLIETAAMMERIRAAMCAERGVDIIVLPTSGYRSPLVNRAVGGDPNSAHLKALAVDFKAPMFGAPYEVAKFIARRMADLGVGQVIHEYGRWVHVSSRTPAKIVDRVITKSNAGTEVGIQVVA